jgi:hypothetical protein
MSNVIAFIACPRTGFVVKHTVGFPCRGSRSNNIIDKRASKHILSRIILQLFTLSRARKNGLSEQKIKLDRNRMDEGRNGMFSTHKRQTHTNTHTHTSTHTHTHSDTYTHTHSERERKRERERLTDRQTDMQRKKDVPYTSHMQIAERSTKKACWFRYSPVLAVSCVTVHLLVLTKWHTDHVSSLQLHHSILSCCRSRRHRDQITRVTSC